MKMLVPVIVLSLLAVPHFAAAEGDIVLLDGGGANLSSLNISVVPGSSNSTSFRVAAQGGNISSIALFYLGGLNVTLSSNNITNLADGDFRNVTVTVALGNNSTAGIKAEKLVFLSSKPGSRELDFYVTVPETAAWSVASEVNISRNVSSGEAGLLSEISLNNSGNFVVNGRVSVIDLAGLVWLDEANFTLVPGGTLVRPLYFVIPNGTRPGTHGVNVSFFDALGNARRLNVFANDTSGTVAVKGVNFSVSRFNFLTSAAGLNFLRFRPGEQRNLVLLKSLQQVSVNISMAKLQSTNENNSLEIKVQGESIGREAKAFTFSGDLLLSVKSANETDFSGELAVQAPPEVANGNPAIAFRGAVGNYSVSLPETFTVAGVRISCSPEDAGVYENSSYVCTSRYPVDANRSELAITVPKQSYEAQLRGSGTETGTLREQRNAAQGLNVMLFAAFVALAATAAFKLKVWDKTHFKW